MSTNDEVDALSEAVRLRAELKQARSQFFPTLARANFNVMMQATAEACFKADLNGEEFFLPRDMFRSTYHCMHGVIEGPLKLLIETQHLDWMRGQVPPDSVFVDVGSATGAIALPMSRVHGGRIHVIAFEPARNTLLILRRALEVNAISNVEVMELAVSSKSGEVAFSEYSFDESGTTPWQPEGSSITHNGIEPGTRTYRVGSVTLDAFFEDRSDRRRVAMVKVDVEGFEVDVVDGAGRLIEEVSPKFAIDIHKHPFAPGTTEQPIRERLAAWGYKFQKLGHVLLCQLDTDG